MTSHELLENQTVTPEALLQARIDDPIGPLAQAASMIRFSLQLSHRADEVYLDLAKYASDTHDRELMVSCFEALQAPDQWRIFEYELARDNTALPIGSLACMGESRALLAQKDKEATETITEIHERVTGGNPRTYTLDFQETFYAHLHTGSLSEIQEEFEASLSQGSLGEQYKRKRALRLTVLAKSLEANNAITEAESTISGFYATISALAVPPFNLQDEKERQAEWEAPIQDVLSKIKAMPFSSLRAKRLLEVASIEQQLLHLPRTGSEEVPALFSDKLMCSTWNVIVDTFTDRLLDDIQPEWYSHPEWLRDLWNEFKAAGLTFKKLRRQDPYYHHPKFKPATK